MTYSAPPVHTVDTAAPVADAPAGIQPPAPDRAALSRLRAERVVSSAGWQEAMDFCGFTPNGAEWRTYWQHILLLGGALFLTAGVLFFFAWNWADMHRFGKMAVVGAVVAATGFGAVWRGPDSSLGRILLLCCGISVGPMLAVFGQTYQTGAELWELFRVWTLVLFGLALAGRQAALWFVTWLSGNIFVMLWLGRTMSEPLQALGMFSLLPECVLALAVAVAVWEFAAIRFRAGQAPSSGPAPLHGWLRSRWLPRLLFFDLTVRLTVYLFLWICIPEGLSYRNVLFLPYEMLPALALVVAGASWYWHRKRMPDLFMLACLVAAGCVLVVSVLLKAELFFEAGVGAVFLWGLIIVGLTAGAGKLLLTLQRQMEQGGEKAVAASHGNAVLAFFSPSRPAPSWNVLWAHLKGKGLLEAHVPLPDSVAQSGAPASPWYVQSLLAVGGWIAAVLSLVFLALFLFVSMNIHSGEATALFLASWLPLGAAYVSFKATGNFVRHFGLSQAIAGSAAACIGLVWMLELWQMAPFLCAALLAGLYFVMNNAAYRFFAALVIVQFVAVGIRALIFGEPVAWHTPNVDWSVLYRSVSVVTAIWWAGVSVGLAAMWVHEKDWLARPAWHILEPAFFGAYGGMMLFLIISLSARGGLVQLLELGMGRIFFPSGSFGVGFGAAVGVVFLAWHLTRGREKAERGAVMACSALALPLGWFLPGVGLAALGLSLSRYSGNHVMQGVTASFLFAYMIYYYYFLGVTLLQKSLLLFVTGGVLLCLAFALNRLGAKRWGGLSHA